MGFSSVSISLPWVSCGTSSLHEMVLLPKDSIGLWCFYTASPWVYHGPAMGLSRVGIRCSNGSRMSLSWDSRGIAMVSSWDHGAPMTLPSGSNGLFVLVYGY